MVILSLLGTLCHGLYSSVFQFCLAPLRRAQLLWRMAWFFLWPALLLCISITSHAQILWLKSDAGVNCTTDNCAVTSWADQTGTNSNFIAANGPTLDTNHSDFNFNSTINFSGTSHFVGPSGFADFTSGITVFAAGMYTDNALYGRIFDFGNGEYNSNIILAREHVTTNLVYTSFNGSTDGNVYWSNQITTNQPYLFSTVHGAGSTQVNAYSLGKSLGVKTSQITPNVTRTINYIGRSNWAADSYFHGRMGEVIIYNTALSPANRLSIETYLALKYGMLLDSSVGNYTRNGTTLYSFDSTYDYGIAGIGEDTDLHQRISKSNTSGAAMTIATNNDFTSPNTDSGRTALTSGQYLLWGHDDGSVSTTQTTEINTNLFVKRIGREWKIRNTGSVGAVSVKLDNLPALSGAQFYQLLYSPDSNFGAGVENLQSSTSSSGIFTNVTIPDGTGFLTVAVAVPPTVINCPAGSTSTGSGYAASGSGQFKDEIFWLDWSCGGQTLSAGSTINKTWTDGGGLSISAQITNLSYNLTPYPTGSWGGDTLDNLYSGINPIAVRNSVVGEDPSFVISFSASLNGVSINPNMVLANAEESGGASEGLLLTTNGQAWQILESTGTMNATFFNNAQSIKMDDLSNTGAGTILALSNNATSFVVDIFGGTTAVGFGFFAPKDYGDAPSTYGNSAHLTPLSASGGSQPTATTNNASLTNTTLSNSDAYYIGTSAADYDAGPQNNTAANGDDNNGADDETLTIPTLYQDITSYINVPVAGTGGYLQVFADWNADGVFTTSGDQIATNYQDGGTGDIDLTANGTIRIAVRPPANATTSQTYLRFRWSSVSGLNSIASTINGETEDYAITVLAHSNPPTQTCPVGTNVALTGTATQSRDYFASGYDALHAIDDYTGGQYPADEFALTFNSTHSWWTVDLGSSQNLSYIEVWNRTAGGSSLSRLSGFHLFISETPFPTNDPLEYSDDLDTIINNTSVFKYQHPDATPPVTTTVPVATNGRYVRVQLPATEFLELAEVKIFTCPEQDHGDAPASYGDPIHYINASYYMGAVVPDAETSAANSTNADGDDTNGSDDEDLIIPTLYHNISSYINVPVSGSSGYLQVFADWGADGSFATVGDQIAVDYQDGGTGDLDLSANGVIRLAVLPPAAASTSLTYLRLRWSATSGLNSTGSANTGEVEDYAITVRSNSTNSSICGAVSLSNTAPSGTATQSSTYNSNIAANAIDNDTGGNLSTDTLAISDYEVNPWWTLDLGSIQPIENITIWNRTNSCCTDRLEKFHLFVSETPFGTSGNSSTDMDVAIENTSGFKYQSTDTSGSVSETVTVNAAGRYVRLQMPKKSVFNLAEVQVNTCAGIDRGDAPSSYGDPTHMVGGFYIGSSLPDFNPSTIHSTDANGDDTSGTDDEATIIPNLYQNISSYINIPVTGTSGYLQAFADWNADGNFTTAGDQFAINYQDGGTGDLDKTVNGVIRIAVRPPANATTSQTYLRLRWSGTSGLNSTDTGSNGEVEDYAITILAHSNTNAEMCASNTNLALTGTASQSSNLLPSSYLAANAINGDTGGAYPSDGLSITSDGVHSWWQVDLGSSQDIDHINIWNRTDCCGDRLSGFHVFVSNSTFPNTGDHAADLDSIINDGNVEKYQYTDTTPSASTAVPMNTNGRYIRVQIPSKNELALGEVQVMACTPADYGDAPSSYGDPSHAFDADYYIGSTAPDIESSNVHNTAANGDDTSGSDDETTIIPTLYQGISSYINVPVSESNGYLQAFADWDADGSFATTGDQFATDYRDGSTGDLDLTTNGVIRIAVRPPANATTSQTYLRLRWSSTAGYDSVSSAIDGEVEDYAIIVQAISSNTSMCSTTTNVALSGTPSQSSNYDNGSLAPKAIDNNTSGVGTDLSIAHTQNELHAWWTIDLGSVQNIENVNIWNRTDSFALRMQGVHLFVSQTPFPDTSNLSVDMDSIMQSGSIFKYQHPDGSFPAPNVLVNVATAGRYVRVQLPRADFMNLAELQVNACAGTDRGDAPSSYGDPTHTIGSGFYIGSSLPDFDPSTVYSSGADGDDTAGTDDEDTIIPTLYQNVSSYINVSVAGTSGYLQAFADWGADGSFATTGDQIAVDYQDGGTGDLDKTVNGSIRMAIRPPANASTSQTYLRLRWSSTAGLNSVASANNGEVEDYSILVQAISSNTSMCSTTTNTALSGTATQSSTYSSSSTAADAIDGITSGTNTSGSIAHTNYDLHAWWTVDLGSIQDIETINIWNRTNTCCDQRMSGVHLFVSQTPFPDTSNLSADMDSIMQSSSIFKYQYADGSFPAPNVLVNVAAAGRYVRVQLPRAETLNLAEVQVNACAGTDRGDAPSSYGDPTHTIGSGFYIGASLPDFDPSTIYSSGADGDDTSGSDDEATIIPTLYEGMSSYINVPVSGTNGYLQGFADWNADGSFATSGDQFAINYQDGGTGDLDETANGVIRIAVRPPSGSVGNSYLRLRWSSTSGLNSADAASNGEVQDFSISMAPTANGVSSCSTQTNVARGGLASQSSDHNGNYFLAEAANNGLTIGDTGTGSNAINHTYNNLHEWWTIDLGSSHLIDNINVYNRADCCQGRLSAYHLFISDTPFPDTGNYAADLDTIIQDAAVHKEQYANSTPPHLTNTVVSTTGRYVRVQLPRVENLHMAEVEVNVCGTPDRGDAPASYGEPLHFVDSNFYIGDTVPDTETSAANNAAATGDDTTGTADEGSEYISDLLAGSNATYTVDVVGTGGYLQAWLDINNDGDFNDAGEQIATDIQDNGSGDLANATTGKIKFSIPSTITAMSTYLRLRWSSIAGLTSTSPAANGEVEDYAVTIDAAAPFTCNSDLYVMAKTSNTTHVLYVQTISAGTSTVTSLGNYSKEVNSLGYNTNDNYLYSIDRDIFYLTRIGSNGKVYPVGFIEGLPDINFNAGAFDSSGNFYISGSEANTRLYSIVVQNAILSNTSTATFSNTPDYAIPPSSAYAYGIIYNGSAFRLPLNLSAPTAFGPNHNRTFASVYADAAGIIYVSERNTLEISRLNISDGTLSLVATGPSSPIPIGGQDGAFCKTAYFAGTQNISITATKTVAIYDPGSTGLYSLPGNDISHTITVSNTGAGSADYNSIELIDKIEPQNEFYNGDYNEAGSGTNPVIFTNNSSGLSYTYTNDVAYSNSATKPANFAACTYSPSAGYDADIRYVCINPKGAMASGNPDPSFAVTYRTRIK